SKAKIEKPRSGGTRPSSRDTRRTFLLNLNTIFSGLCIIESWVSIEPQRPQKHWLSVHTDPADESVTCGLSAIGEL
ncbi:hypothetical protein CH333_02805, partial [candidate division WOR-3 bacterium JGI_Cruoil_03_44_89]